MLHDLIATPSSFAFQPHFPSASACVNLASRIFPDDKFTPITPKLRGLHWLLIKLRSYFKISPIVYKMFHCLSLSNLSIIVLQQLLLRSPSSSHLLVSILSLSNLTTTSKRCTVMNYFGRKLYNLKRYKTFQLQTYFSRWIEALRSLITWSEILIASNY